MINLKLVSMLEEQSTVGTAPLLPFEQGGQSGIDRRVLSLSFTPVHPIPIVRTPIARDLGVPQARGVTMGGEIRLTRTGGRCGKHPSGRPHGASIGHEPILPIVGCRLRPSERSFTQVRRSKRLKVA